MCILNGFEKKVSIRNPYAIKKIPLLGKIYKSAYDKSSLSNPTILYKGKILERSLFFALYKMGLFGYGSFFIKTKNGEKKCTFNARNTQFHAIYFDRFKNFYEPEVSCLLDILIKNEYTVFFDIGANWGYFTGFVASNENFKGKIYAAQVY